MTLEDTGTLTLYAGNHKLLAVDTGIAADTPVHAVFELGGNVKRATLEQNTSRANTPPSLQPAAAPLSLAHWGQQMLAAICLPLLDVDARVCRQVLSQLRSLLDAAPALPPAGRDDSSAFASALGLVDRLLASDLGAHELQQAVECYVTLAVCSGRVPLMLQVIDRLHTWISGESSSEPIASPALPALQSKQRKVALASLATPTAATSSPPKQVYRPLLLTLPAVALDALQLRDEAPQHSLEAVYAHLLSQAASLAASSMLRFLFFLSSSFLLLSSIFQMNCHAATCAF